ncbi:hypothetical protein ACF053_27440 [Streptomyces kanasensis]|uniref:hypothetical protein n=1 Tax=Streptomyces kanasensis TaxID=936756 RepID=UPI0036F96BFB
MAVFGTAHRRLLDGAVSDARRLVELPPQEEGTGGGRSSPSCQAASRSAVVLICASWETFCGELAAEALNHLASHAPHSAALPKEVKKTLRESLLDTGSELAVWDLADDGWRAVLRTRAAWLTRCDRSLRTVKPPQVKEFFRRNLGIVDITAAWLSDQSDQQRTVRLLDDFVALGSDIAHGRARVPGVSGQARDGLELIRRLAEKTAEYASDHLRAHTGAALPEFGPPPAEPGEAAARAEPGPGGAAAA